MRLFDSNSTSVVSERFKIGKQVSVYATGLAAGDEITFEMVVLDDVPTPMTSSCDAACDPGYPITQAVVVGSTVLTCCSGSTRPPVVLTAGRSHIIIDSPQNVWVRAIYTGPNLGAFIVWQDTTDVVNVTESMRGCCSAPSSGGGTSGPDNYVVAASVSSLGVVTLTMSNGSTVVSNEPAPSC